MSYELCWLKYCPLPSSTFMYMNCVSSNNAKFLDLENKYEQSFTVIDKVTSQMSDSIIRS